MALSQIHDHSHSTIKTMFTYEQLRQLAVQSGIADNKVSIGFWIKAQGLKKVRKQIDKKERFSTIKMKKNPQDKN